MIQVEDVQVGYGDALIIDSLNLTIPKGKITTVIGPNGCGKSTLIKTIARILKANSGAIYLDGKAISRTSTKDIARKMAILPQSAEAPAGLTVRELITYGRFPHQSKFGKQKQEDLDAIDWALEATGLTELESRPVEALSGGQRQRVWIAMALAQDTEVVILDEPTTYLDMAHQLDILQLLDKLNKEQNKTIVMVLHDLNHASRFSHNLIAMRDGKVLQQGAPHEVMTAPNLQDVFQIQAMLTVCPFSQNPICLSYGMKEA
ncbi:putative siderophore transport system ATP-binding protein YusV [Oceanobacillus picturae]|uniref:Siderophore transport system ATP-binding protein YusV n=1 Tax=Oceanobacillus picturae TaxID=171693 RepID=W9APA6_9BACI|nr:ABC transporter ATP-binding protein [Oceanobacillus picturae]AVR00890.1 iron ABC transporter ATP-binding protein [Oceanobacillus iheyensis]RIU93481.1 ABC transporter ATP-binding protein [Oceanobacillus picturae]CDO04717.1 putative siderophore transport system ATP-binding protein YusV [Oceanobacillus picturae]